MEWNEHDENTCHAMNILQEGAFLSDAVSHDRYLIINRV